MMPSLMVLTKDVEKAVVVAVVVEEVLVPKEVVVIEGCPMAVLDVLVSVLYVISSRYK